MTYFEQFARALLKLQRETPCCKYRFLQICWTPTKALHLSWCKWYLLCVRLYHPPKRQVIAARFEATFTIHRLSRVLSLADMQSCYFRLSSCDFAAWQWRSVSVEPLAYCRKINKFIGRLRNSFKSWSVNACPLFVNNAVNQVVI